MKLTFTAVNSNREAVEQLFNQLNLPIVTNGSEKQCVYANDIVKQSFLNLLNKLEIFCNYNSTVYITETFEKMLPVIKDMTKNAKTVIDNKSQFESLAKNCNKLLEVK